MNYVISFHGIKGGVGKSTLALMLGKSMALLGKRVLVVDRDTVGYASYLMGVRDKGLIAKLAYGDKELELCFNEFSLNGGRLALLKYYGDGERAYDDVKVVFSNPSLRQRLMHLMGRFLGKDYDYVVWDNPSLARFSDYLMSHDIEILRSAMPHFSMLRIYVSSESPVTIRSTIKYLATLESEAKMYGIAGMPLAIIINMVPPTTELSSLRSELQDVIRAYGIPYGLIIPFNEELMGFNEGILDLPVVDEIAFLGRGIVESRFSGGTIYSSLEVGKVPQVEGRVAMKNGELSDDDLINALVRIARSHTTAFQHYVLMLASLRGKDETAYLKELAELMYALRKWGIDERTAMAIADVAVHDSARFMRILIRALARKV